MTNGFRLRLMALSLLAAFGQVHASVADRVSTVTYNAQGLVDTSDGPRTDVSDVTHFGYDAQGRLASVTDALGHVTTFDTYDTYGNPGRSIDANNATTLMTYTPEGWLATQTRDSTGTPSTSTFTYNASGDVIQTQDADGVVMNYTYDDARRLTDVTDGAGNRIHYTLDAAGNRTKEETFDASSTLKRSLSRSFNSLSQILTVADALNRTVLSFNYPDGHDALGNVVHSSDANGVQKKLGYDGLNRLVSTISDYNGTNAATQNTQSVSSYDASDNLEGISDPNGLNTIYDHNGLGDPTALHSPDTGTTAFVYDAAGNKIQQTDAKGVVVNYTYDALNRLTASTYADATLNAAYHYDEGNSVTGCGTSLPVGHLTRVVENTVTTAYCYDARGNVVQKRQAQGTQVDVTSYGYTLADRLSSVSSPSLTVTQYSRDALGNITGVGVTTQGGTAQTVVSGATYLPFGPVTSYTLGNGQAVARTYNANYQLTDLTSPTFSLHFDRDAIGNITALGSVQGASPAIESYAYDPLYRLASVNDASGQAIEAYTYNQTGDRLSKTSAGGLATGTYGYQTGTHWLTSIGNAARTYDLNGNTTGAAVAGQTFGYGYDGRNRLTVVQANQQTVGTYSYNVFGQRIAKVTGSPQMLNERFVYNEGGQLLGEYGTSNRDYVWMGDLPVAAVDGAGATATVNFVVADGLGTPRSVNNASGAQIWQWPYETNPFGEKQPTSVSGYTFNLRFPGQYFDVERGLAYNVNRDYDASVGRYVESDPLGLKAGVDTYAYVNENPLNYIDPAGLDSGCMLTGTCGQTSNSGGLFGFGSVGGGLGIGPAHGEVESVVLAGYSKKNGAYLGVLSAGGGYVGGEANNVGVYRGVETLTDGTNVKITLYEGNIGVEIPFLLGAGVGGGYFKDSCGETGIYFHFTGGVLGEHAAIGVGVNN